MSKQNEISSYLENISLLLLGILFLTFPLVFTTLATDAFSLPKQILLGAVVLISLILLGAKMISDGSVRSRRTPFDLPLMLIAITALFSSVFAVNRFDSLINLIPFLLVVIAYFIIVNIAKTESSILFLLYSFVTGACLASFVSILSFFKIYILPFAFARSQSFTPFGSLLDQAIYLAVALPLAVHLAIPLFKSKKINGKEIGASVATIFIFGALFATSYQLLTTQKPNILPFETGFQTAFAAISQDAGRTAAGFLFGSGFGTYSIDFTRFKQASFNLNQALWSFTFFRSSSFILELLATTGILGLLSYIFLIVKVLKGNRLFKKIGDDVLFLSIILLIVASLVLPFTFTIQALLFLALGLFAGVQSVKHVVHSKDDPFYDVELHFVAFKKGIIPISTSPVSSASDSLKPQDKFFPVSLFILILAFAGFVGFYFVRYIASDVIFQNSLVAASSNNGLQTYNNQVNAIKIFPYRDAYYRIYSQTNLALANSLAAQQPKGSQPSSQIQQTIYTLIQQSINSARTAVNLSPQTTANWQNLSSIYRSLIGFGQNAESFAITSGQQAVVFNPNNPQEYINLGGIYYQLGQWENAERQFQIAVALKPDFANAYYNLGHALEAKGDLQNALIQYQTVKSLITNDPNNLKKIVNEIEELQQKIGQAKEATNAGKTLTPSANQPPLSLSTPSAQLPQQKPPVKIPSPEEKNIVSPTPTPNLSP